MPQILLKRFPRLGAVREHERLVHHNRRFTAGDLVVQLLEAFRRRLIPRREHVRQLRIDHVHGHHFGRERHQLRVLRHHIHNAAEIRLELKQFARLANSRFNAPVDKRICNDRPRGLIEHAIAAQPAHLWNNTETVSIKHSDHAPAVQRIQQIVPVPMLRNFPLEYRHSFLQQIALVVVYQLGILAVNRRGGDLRQHDILVVVEYRRAAVTTHRKNLPPNTL